jgi:Gpi18-like mannosyltransferase
MLQYGTKNFYESPFWGFSWPNQPFGSMLLFAFLAILKNVIFSFFLLLNNAIPAFPSKLIFVFESSLHSWLVKLPFILSDIVIGFLIYKVVKKFGEKKALLASSLFIFNPVILYNSAIWGQTDALINLLSISGLYLTYKKKYFPGIILFLSSYLFKLSLIIYIPIFFILLFKRLPDWKRFILPTFLFALFVILIAVPFSGDKNPVEWLWYMYNGKVLTRQGDMLNGNAFNLWFLIFGVDFSKSEFIKFGNLTYQTWGRLLLFAYLIPVLYKFFKSKLTLTSLLNAALLTAFGTFIFLTNMHERYLYPIFPLFTMLLFIQNSKYTLKSLIILSLIHLLNMYNLWFYPNINFIKDLLLVNNFIYCKILSLILIIYCFTYLIRYLKSENIQ